MDIKHVDSICKDHDNRPDQLIGILQDVQEHYRYLPKHPLERVAELLNVPLAQVYAVATFFKAFSLEPRGEHELHVCMGTACHVRGAQQVLEELQRELDINAGETTADKFVTLETVNCVGACALGPIVVVDGEYHGHITPMKSVSVIPQNDKGRKTKGKK